MEPVDRAAAHQCGKFCDGGSNAKVRYLTKSKICHNQQEFQNIYVYIS